MSLCTAAGRYILLHHAVRGTFNVNSADFPFYRHGEVANAFQSISPDSSNSAAWAACADDASTFSFVIYRIYFGVISICTQWVEIDDSNWKATLLHDSLRPQINMNIQLRFHDFAIVFHSCRAWITVSLTEFLKSFDENDVLLSTSNFFFIQICKVSETHKFFFSHEITTASVANQQFLSSLF